MSIPTDLGASNIILHNLSFFFAKNALNILSTDVVRSKIESRSMQGVLDTTLCNQVCQYLLQVCGFLQVLRFSPPIKLTATI